MENISFSIICEIKLKVTEFKWCITSWFNETILSHIRKWDNCQWTRNVWKCWATCASIEFNIDVKNIIIHDVSWMACWSHLTQHKDILRGSWNISLSSVFVNTILDRIKTQSHSLCNLFWMPCINTTLVFVFNNVKFSTPSVMEAVSSFNSQFLSNLKFNFVYSQLRLGIIDHHVGIRNFIWIEDVFVKVNGEATLSLIHATTCAQVDCLLRSSISNEWNWWLMNHEKLLILHLLMLMCVNGRQDSIFDKALWLSLMTSIVICNWCWKMSW